MSKLMLVNYINLNNEKEGCLMDLPVDEYGNVILKQEEYNMIMNRLNAKSIDIDWDS